MTALFAKLATLDRRAWQDLFIAQAALLKAQWRLKREPVGSLVARHSGDDHPAPTGDPLRARALALAVGRTASHGAFRPFCLVRALALRDLLETNGIGGSSVRVGVRSRRGSFDAHAWVRWGDEILGDQPELIATFTEVDDISVLGRP